MIYDKLGDDFLIRTKTLIKSVLETPATHSPIELGFLCTVLGEQLANFTLMEKMYQMASTSKTVWKVIEGQPIGGKITKMKNIDVDKDLIIAFDEFNTSRVKFIHGYMELTDSTLNIVIKDLLTKTEQLRQLFIDFSTKK